MINTLTQRFKNYTQIQIYECLSNLPHYDYPVSEIAEKIGTTSQTVYNNIGELVSSGLILQSRTVKNTQFYRWAANDETIAFEDGIIAYEIAGSGRKKEIMKKNKKKK